MRNIFIVTSTSLVKKTDVIEDVKNVITNDTQNVTGEKTLRVVHVFYEISQHAPLKDIRKGSKLLSQTDADGIVAVGGGSPIDSAKAIVAEYKKQTGKLLRLVCIPTTLSAAETSIVMGYTGKV